MQGNNHRGCLNMFKPSTSFNYFWPDGLNDGWNYASNGDVDDVFNHGGQIVRDAILIGKKINLNVVCMMMHDGKLHLHIFDKASQYGNHDFHNHLSSGGFDRKRSRGWSFGLPCVCACPSVDLLASGWLLISITYQSQVQRGRWFMGWRGVKCYESTWGVPKMVVPPKS